MGFLSDSDSENWSEEEEEPWHADIKTLEKDVDLNVYKPRHPAWTLGRRDDRALEDKCAPAPGAYLYAEEQALRFSTKKAPITTMAGKPLILLGQSPGPSDYTCRTHKVKDEKPSWSMMPRPTKDDPIESWLKRVPACNLYRPKVDQVKEGHPRFSIRPKAKPPISPHVNTPSPQDYNPQMYRPGGRTFGYRLEMGPDGINIENESKAPGPQDYKPTLVTRVKAPAFTWGKGPERFPEKAAVGVTKMSVKPVKKPHHPPKTPKLPKQTKSSLLRADMKRQTTQMAATTGQGSPDRPRHTAKDVYHEDGSCGDVWPTPEACSKDEDVKIMQDKSYKWDPRPSSGKAIAVRHVPLAKKPQKKNPYEVFKAHAELSMSMGTTRARTRQSEKMFKTFTQMGVQQADTPLGATQ